MKRLVYPILACVTATSLSSCTLLGSLLKTIGRVPGSLLDSVTSVEEAERKAQEQGWPIQPEPVPGAPEGGGEAVVSPDTVLVVAPLEK